MPKISLALDSSGPRFLAGISDGVNTYSLYHTGIKQEQFFLPLVERLLTKAGAEWPDIKHVCFVRGPGRFTGIRISLTFASMLQSLNGAQLSSATLFELLYRQVQVSPAFIKWREDCPQGKVAVVLHAFREEYFLQFFDGTAQGPVWLSKEELKANLTTCQYPLYVAGTDKNSTSLAELLGDTYHLAPLADSRVRIQTLLDLAQHPIYQKDALKPLYLKPARFELNP